MKTTSSPRILYFSTPWPYQSIRGLHVARALQQIGKVEIAIVDAVGGVQKSVECLGTEFKVLCEVGVHSRTPHGIARKLKWTLNPRISFPHGLGVSDLDGDRLIKTARGFDLIWFYKLRLANMFENWSWPKSVLDVDDLPSSFYETASRSSINFKVRLRLAVEILIWKRREKLLGERFQVLASCSEADKRSLNARVPVHVIPNGFERPTGEPVRQPAVPTRIGFVGLFDYYPNVEGVKWFIDKCWPAIKRELPDAQLRLMGRFSETAIPVSTASIDRLGWVEDAAAEIATWSVMVVPLQVGGGARVKIPEGFSRKCPIVSTRVGAFGYEVQNGQELLLADTPAEFAAACISLVRNPATANAMAERAFAAFLRNWTWDAITPRIHAAAEDCLRRSHDLTGNGTVKF